MKIKLKKGRSITLLFLVITVIFVTSLTSTSIFDVDNVSDKEEKINFDRYNLKSSQVSNKIYIYGNQGWADFKSDGNCTGLGTFSDPYIIKDIIIDRKNTESVITIEKSDVYFKIVNVTIYNSGSLTRSIEAGIMLELSNNGSLINNTVVNNHHGIILIGSHNLTISGNNVNESFYGGREGFGIYLLNSNNNTISGNNVYNKIRSGIRLYNSNSNMISGNIVNNNMEGLRLQRSKYNTISRNTISNNLDSGILLIECNITMISNNSITYNGQYGLDLYESNNNLIIGNNLLNNEIPINEHSCSGNTYQNNIIDENLILIIAPIFIGIIFLIISVVFIYKKRVTKLKK